MRSDIQVRQQHQYLRDVPASDQRPGQGRCLSQDHGAHGTNGVERLLGLSTQETTDRQPSREDATRHEHQDDERAPRCRGSMPPCSVQMRSTRYAKAVTTNPRSSRSRMVTPRPPVTTKHSTESPRRAPLSHHEGLHWSPRRAPLRAGPYADSVALVGAVDSLEQLTDRTNASPTRSSAWASTADHGARTNARSWARDGAASAPGPC